jgi:hypothetical protein
VMLTSYSDYHINIVNRNKDALENFFWPLYFKLLRYYRTADPTLKNEIDTITVTNIGKFLPRKVIATKLTHFYHDDEPDQTLVKELIHLVGVRAIEITHETQRFLGIKTHKRSLGVRLMKYFCDVLCARPKKSEGTYVPDPWIKGDHLETLRNLGIEVEEFDDRFQSVTPSSSGCL